MHVEYEWNLRLEEIDESDDDLDDKVCAPTLCFVPYLSILELCFALSVKSSLFTHLVFIIKSHLIAS